MVQVPVLSDLGGPIISCECVNDNDCLGLVWPAITICGQQPHYVVYVNGKKHGDNVSACEKLHDMSCHFQMSYHLMSKTLIN